MKIDTPLRKFPRALPIFILAAVILAAYWKLTTMKGCIITDDIFTSDIMNGEFTVRYFLAQCLRAGEFPLWLPYIWGGYPVLAGTGVCSPIDIVLYGLLPPYVALNVSLLVILVLSAAGTFLYAREIGVDIAGAMVAGISFAFSGFMVSQLKHLGIVGTVCWVPLGLLVLERAMRPGGRSRSFLWLGLIFGIQILNGFIQVAYYSGLLYGVYFLFRILSADSASRPQGKRTPIGERLKSLWSPATAWFVAVMLLGVGIGAVQIIPMAELSSLSFRSSGVSYEFASRFSYDMKNIMMFFYPYANGDIGAGTYTGHSIFWEDYGYIGIVTLALAVYAFAAEWRRRHVLFLGIVGFVAYLFVIGPNTPLYEAAYRWIPGMGFFRFPTRFLFVVHLALALLAGFGLMRLVGRLGRKSKASRDVPPIGFAGAVVFALVVADLVYFQMRQNPIADAARWQMPPRTVERLKEDTTMFRIYSLGAEETHKAAFSMARGWEGDLRPYYYQRDFIQVNTNILFGLSAPDGYSGLTEASVADVWGDNNRPGLIFRTAGVDQNRFVAKPEFQKILNLFNVKYLLLPWELEGAAMTSLGRSGAVYLYKNDNVLPRAFIVGKVRVAKDPLEAQSILLSPGFDPSREAILYNAPPSSIADSQAGSQVKVTRYGTADVRFDVSAAVPGLLVFSDSYYPGWRAEVDGVEQPILETNLCQRGVVVPAGEHRVRFVFDSPKIRTGFLLSMFSLLVILAGGVATRKKGE